MKKLVFFLTVGLSAVIVMMVSANKSTKPPVVSNPDILEPISEADLLRLADGWPEEQRDGALKALRESLEKSKNISDAPVKVKVGEYDYVVPMNYLTERGGYSNTLDERRSLSARIFLPDYHGYTRKNFIDPFHPDRIDLTFYGRRGNNIQTADVLLDRSIRFELVEPESKTTQFGLSGYESLHSSDIVWIGESARGHHIFMECSRGTENEICRVQYKHQKNDYGIFYYYHARHLPQWREIDNKVNDLILSWRRNAQGEETLN